MATWRDLETYLKHNGWEQYGSPRGRDIHYRKVLPDGTVLRTSVSKGTGEIQKGLFETILKKQLKITRDEFNRDK